MANFYAWSRTFNKNAVWEDCYYCDRASIGCIMWSSESRAVCRKCLLEQWPIIALDEMVNE